METTDKVIKLTREESKNLAWAMKALAKDHIRYPLQLILQAGKRLVCVDGFRGHSIPCPESLNGQEKSILRPLTTVGHVGRDEYILAVRTEDANFPDVSKLTESLKEQSFSFGVTCKYMRDALDGIGSTAIIRIWSNQMITAESEDGSKVAIVMPLQISDKLAQAHPIHLVEEKVE